MHRGSTGVWRRNAGAGPGRRYMWATCATGWFCCPTPLKDKMSLKKKDPATGRWIPVDLPRKIEAIIFINLQVS